MSSAAFSRLAAAVAAQKQPAAIERFLLELLTPGEAHDLALRWELVELLVGGVSQRQIASRLGISLCKITRGAKILKKRDGAVAASLGKTSARKADSTGAKAPGGKVAAAKKPAGKAVAKPAAKSVRTKTVKKVGGKNGTRVPGKSKNQVRR